MNLTALSVRAVLSLVIAAAAAPASADYVLRLPHAVGGAQVSAPTIGQLLLPEGLTVDSPQFTLTAPTSTSAGGWTYSSSDPAVATISGTTVTITGEGTTAITATQAAEGSYTGGSASATLTVAPAPVAAAASCNTLLTATPGLASGWYTFDPDGTGPAVEMGYYCDMASAGGGWTRVVRQTEAEPVTNWNGGVNGASYALAQAQIPEHTRVGFGRDEQATALDYVQWQYTTGTTDPAVSVTNPDTGASYLVARSAVIYYQYLDPNLGSGGSCDLGGGNNWCDALSIYGSGHTKKWSFAPRNTYNVAYRGYALGTTYLYGSTEAYAWTVWVR